MKVKAAITSKIFELTEKVGPEKTICPSEVARDLWPQDWRGHMDDIRSVAVELQSQHKIEITQKGEPVQGPDFVGPIRLKKVTSF